MGAVSQSPTTDHHAERPRLSASELEQLLADVAPEAVLLPPRILRRVSREEQLPRRWRLPQNPCYAIGRQRLLDIVDPAELPTETAARLPDELLLLPEPDAEELESTPAAELLTRYWRWLFHGRALRQLERQRTRGELDPARLRRCVQAVGMAAWAEARTVLVQEGRLAAEPDEMAVLAEFVATYFELRSFFPSIRQHYFPGLDDERACQVFSELLDAEGLLASTRPRGAKLPGDEPPPIDEVEPGSIFSGLIELQTMRQSSRQSPRYCQLLVARAEKAAARRNWVRACILLQRARKYAADKDVHRLRSLARGHLVRLLGALQEAIQFPDAEIDAWRDALSSLVTRAAVGLRSREARLLFDLQKVAIDHQRQVFRVDTWGWLRSLGRQPLRRPLPRLTKVLIHQHLGSARRRVRAVRIADVHRVALQGLLKRAEERSEQQLRTSLRPVLAQALEDADLLPSNPVEQVAARKLVEELLDRILERGFLAIGDLRDAVARNQLKCRDLAGLEDLRRGDQLLAADRQMGLALDGVYRRGEVYMRAMQRLSSVAFGTGWGRLLMRFLVLPFGGAFVLEVGLRHLLQMLREFAGAASAEQAIANSRSPEAFEIHTAIVLVVGLFFFLLINSEGFRRGLWHWLRAVGRGIHYLAADLPQRLLQLEMVRRLFQSRYYRWLVRGLLKPAVATALLVWLLAKLTPQWSPTSLSVGTTFVVVNLLLNSRLGRDLEELVTEGVGRLLRWLGQCVAWLFWLFLDFLRAAVEATERLLYFVDEWLRFRSGDNRLALALKAVFGGVWSVLAYIIRFCVNLLIEPQVNPIKHFPVVTVSHKLLLPFTPALAKVFMLAMDKELAYTCAGAIIISIPGIFGFLAWELRENWRLYAANRSPVLRPTVIGKHGESMRRLLLPGLHSGTIPKRFAKLRHAEWEAVATGRWSRVRKHSSALEELHVEVRRFVERDLLWLLNSAACWDGARLYLADVALATNRVRIDLRLDEAAASLRLEFLAREGWLLARVSKAELLEQLSPRQRQALATAICGLDKSAGVDLVCQEVERQLPPAAWWDLGPDQLRVWPAGFPETTIRYHLDTEQLTARPEVEGPAPPAVPPLVVPRLLFRQLALPWTCWVEAWEALTWPLVDGQPPALPECLSPSASVRQVLPGGSGQ